MTDTYELRFPDYLDGYEMETEAKGYLPGVAVVVRGVKAMLTVYDPSRIAQQAADEVMADGFLAVSNLLVVGKVTRDGISAAVAKLADSDFDGIQFD